MAAGYFCSYLPPPVPLAHERDRDVRPIGDEAVDAPVEQAPDVVHLIHGPDHHRDPRIMRSRDELRCDHARTRKHLRHLERVEDRPGPDAVQSAAHVLCVGPGPDGRRQRPHGVERALLERANRHAGDCVGGVNLTHNGLREARVRRLQFDDDGGLAVAIEHVPERRHADAHALEREPSIALESAARVESGQFRRGPPVDGPGGVRCPVQRGVVHDHRHAVARQADVQFDPVCTGGKPGAEGHERVLRCQGRTAPMRIDHGPHGFIFSWRARSSRIGSSRC